MGGIKTTHFSTKKQTMIYRNDVRLSDEEVKKMAIKAAESFGLSKTDLRTPIRFHSNYHWSDISNKRIKHPSVVSLFTDYKKIDPNIGQIKIQYVSSVEQKKQGDRYVEIKHPHGGELDNGALFIDATGKMIVYPGEYDKLYFLLTSPEMKKQGQKGGYFLYNPRSEAEIMISQDKIKSKAKQILYLEHEDITETKLREYAVSKKLISANNDDVTIEMIQAKLLSMTNNEPEKFINEVFSSSVEVSAMIKELVENRVIKYESRDQSWRWGLKIDDLDIRTGDFVVRKTDGLSPEATIKNKVQEDTQFAGLLFKANNIASNNLKNKKPFGLIETLEDAFNMGLIGYDQECFFKIKDGQKDEILYKAKEIGFSQAIQTDKLAKHIGTKDGSHLKAKIVGMVTQAKRHRNKELV